MTNKTRIYPAVRPRKPRTPYSYRKVNKYKAAGRREDGRFFHSNAEADRYLLLKQAQEKGLIRNLQCQIPFNLVVNGQHICQYRADFQYIWLSPTGSQLGVFIEDVKGMVLSDYVIKRKLMMACHRIEVLELPARLVNHTMLTVGGTLRNLIQSNAEKKRQARLAKRRAPKNPDNL